MRHSVAHRVGRREGASLLLVGSTCVPLLNAGSPGRASTRTFGSPVYGMPLMSGVFIVCADQAIAEGEGGSEAKKCLRTENRPQISGPFDKFQFLPEEITSKRGC